jgi:hypothetical protein
MLCCSRLSQSHSVWRLALFNHDPTLGLPKEPSHSRANQQANEVTSSKSFPQLNCETFRVTFVEALQHMNVGVI